MTAKFPARPEVRLESDWTVARYIDREAGKYNGSMYVCIHVIVYKSHALPTRVECVGCYGVACSALECVNIN